MTGELLDKSTGQAERSPQVEHAEDQPNHDDVPGLVAQRPRGKEQLRNPMECRTNRNVLEHQKSMGNKEQRAGDASH